MLQRRRDLNKIVAVILLISFGSFSFVPLATAQAGSCAWQGGNIGPWDIGCNVSVPSRTVLNGQSTETFQNTVSDYTGSISFTCNNGSFIPVNPVCSHNASCTWKGGNIGPWDIGCNVSVPARTVSSGQSTETFQNAVSGYTGSISFTCNNGSFVPVNPVCAVNAPAQIQTAPVNQAPKTIVDKPPHSVLVANTSRNIPFEAWMQRQGARWVPAGDEGGGNFWRVPLVGEEGGAGAWSQDVAQGKYQEYLEYLTRTDDQGRPLWGSEQAYIPEAHWNVNDESGEIGSAPAIGVEKFIGPDGKTSYSRIGDPEFIKNSADYGQLTPSIIYDSKWGYAVPTIPWEQLTAAVVERSNQGDFFSSLGPFIILMPVAMAFVGSTVFAGAEAAGAAAASTLAGETAGLTAAEVGALADLSVPVLETTAPTFLSEVKTVFTTVKNAMSIVNLTNSVVTGNINVNTLLSVAGLPGVDVIPTELAQPLNVYNQAQQVKGIAEGNPWAITGALLDVADDGTVTTAYIPTTDVIGIPLDSGDLATEKSIVVPRYGYEESENGPIALVDESQVEQAEKIFGPATNVDAEVEVILGGSADVAGSSVQDPMVGFVKNVDYNDPEAIASAREKITRIARLDELNHGGDAISADTIAYQAGASFDTFVKEMQSKAIAARNFSTQANYIVADIFSNNVLNDSTDPPQGSSHESIGAIFDARTKLNAARFTYGEDSRQVKDAEINLNEAINADPNARALKEDQIATNAQQARQIELIRIAVNDALDPLSKNENAGKTIDPAVVAATVAGKVATVAGVSPDMAIFQGITAAARSNSGLVTVYAEVARDPTYQQAVTRLNAVVDSLPGLPSTSRVSSVPSEPTDVGVHTAASNGWSRFFERQQANDLIAQNASPEYKTAKAAYDMAWQTALTKAYNNLLNSLVPVATSAVSDVTGIPVKSILSPSKNSHLPMNFQPGNSFMSRLLALFTPHAFADTQSSDQTLVRIAKPDWWAPGKYRVVSPASLALSSLSNLSTSPTEIAMGPFIQLGQSTYNCASDIGGCVSDITSSVYTPPPATATLSASPMSIGYNENSTITWDSSHATTCTAGGPWSNSGALSGSVSTGSLTADTTYTLQCSGRGGESSLQSVTVVVPSTHQSTSQATPAHSDSSTKVIAPSSTTPASPTHSTNNTNSTNPGVVQPAQTQSVSQPNQTVPPTTFVTNFYTWYLQGLRNDQGFDSSGQFKSVINNWLTSDFIANWNTLSENTGSDPALLAQDYQNSWITNIQAVVVNQTSTASTVIVSLGTSSELHRLNVHLAMVNGKWRIASVVAEP